MASSEITEGLGTCELFSQLSEEEIQVLTTSLAAGCEMEAFKAGDHIFEQGEHSARFYIITDGQVLLQRSLNIGDRTATWPLGLLGKGRAMGWSALLYGPRVLTASAICRKPTRIISIEGDSLRSVLAKQPETGFKVMDRLACMLGERLRAAYNTMEAHL
ncbi:cyclic nucleotide-binding domain-containing protein [Chloroflexota bacterium]